MYCIKIIQSNTYEIYKSKHVFYDRPVTSSLGAISIYVFVTKLRKQQYIIIPIKITYVVRYLSMIASELTKQKSTIKMIYTNPID